MSKECAKEERNMKYGGNTTDGASEHVVYSSQSQDLRAKNNYLTSLSFQLDDYCVLAAEMPAGVVVPLHSHADRESFYLLSGEMTFYDGDSWRILRQGDFVDVFGNTKHAWRNASESSASLLVVTTVRMGIFLQRVSSSVETKVDTRADSRRQEHFFKLVQEHGCWMGSPADNKAIGLSSDWHSTADQTQMEHA
jgi:mannose-6-phosphate isomerase-like protein (cupin superfamily)